MVKNNINKIGTINDIDCIIFTGGEKIAKSKLKPYLDFKGLVIACDSGIETALKHGFIVDYAVGDFDSIGNKKLLDHVKKEILTYPKEKDDSDTELGIKLATKMGKEHILLIGGSGGRSDHFLANLDLLKQGYPIKYWLTRYEYFVLLDKNEEIFVSKQKTLSLCVLKMPIDLECTNLKWQITKEYWQSHAISLSNVSSHDFLNITISKGLAVLIIPHLV